MLSVIVLVYDEITALTFEDEFHIQVTFKGHGAYRITNISNNREAFNSLKKMHVGQKVSVGIERGKLVEVNPE